ncbi:hypothetical protein ABIB62_000624 [Mucilaginibacter sp. UYP25]
MPMNMPTDAYRREITYVNKYFVWATTFEMMFSLNIKKH